MHLYAITRGQLSHVDFLIQQLNTMFLPYKAKGKDENGKDIEQVQPMQFAVRPIQLWEFAFPKEELERVCLALWGNDLTHGYALPRDTMKLKMMTKAIKLGLNLDDIPKWDVNAKLPLQNFLWKPYVTVLGLGIKHDKEEKYGEGL